MKKKIIVLLSAITLAVSLGNGAMSTVMAADEDLGKVVDGSILTMDEESEATLDPDTIFYIDDDSDDSGIMPYGTYFLDGTAAIRNAGGGKIVASGDTNAKRSCKLKVAVVVQRYSSSSGAWNYVTSWTASKASGTHLSTSKTISVKRGYFYRVKTTHSAGGEVGYATTDGIKIK